MQASRALPWLATTFVLGVGVGYLGSEMSRDDSISWNDGDVGSNPSLKSEEEVLATERELGARPANLERRGKSRDNERDEDRDDDRPTRSTGDVQAEFQAALASGNLKAAREALHSRIDPDAVFTEEEIEAWNQSLESAPLELVHDLASFLARSGGGAGAKLVASWVTDSEAPLEFRHRAIHGLASVGEEHVGNVSPVLEGLLANSDLPKSLFHDTAHAYGRLHSKTGEGAGFDALLTLAQQRPEIGAATLIQAAGDFGSAGDAGKLLGLLGGDSDWSRKETSSILGAIGRAAARSGESSALLDLLANPPESVLPHQVARAISEASRELGAGILEEALAATKGDQRAQEAIAHAMAENGRAGLDALLKASENPDISLAPEALARALSHVGGREAVPAMLDLLSSSNDREFLEPLARGIIENGGASSVNKLVEQLEGDTDLAQRRAIAQALGDMGGAEAIDPSRLLNLLGDSRDPELSDGLARAIDHMEPAAAQEKALELFDAAESRDERLAFARLLARGESPSGMNALADQLQRESEPGVQREYARLLARSGEQGGASLNDFIVSDAPERSRFEALSGIEEAGRRAVARNRDLLSELASEDQSPMMRRRAVEILGRHGEASDLAELQTLRGREQHPDVLRHIDHAIRRISNSNRR